MIYNLNDYGDILSTEDVRKILRKGPTGRMNC